jgi:hypothetical protein
VHHRTNPLFAPPWCAALREARKNQNAEKIKRVRDLVVLVPLFDGIWTSSAIQNGRLLIKFRETKSGKMSL